MDPKLEFFSYVAAAACFLLAVLGGTRRGAVGQPAPLVAVGLLLWLLPTLWAAGERAF